MLEESNRSLHFIVVRHRHQLICLLKVDFVFNNKSNPPTLKSGDLHFTPETFPDQKYAVPFNEEKALIWAFSVIVKTSPKVRLKLLSRHGPGVLGQAVLHNLGAGASTASKLVRLCPLPC